MSWLDDLAGIKDLYDAAGNLFTRRSKLKISGNLVTLADNPAQGRTDLVVSSTLGFTSSRTITDAADTLVLSDAGAKIYGDRATGIALTVPPNADVAFDSLDEVTVIQIGAGAITLTAGSGVTLVPPNGKTLVTNGAADKNAVVGMTPRPDALDTWDVYGDLV